MRARRWTPFAVAIGAALGPSPTRADDAAMLAKLDAIERRLAHIEAMEMAKGRKTPFAVTVPISSAGGQGNAAFAPMCKSIGYEGTTSVTGPPGAPNGITIICYEP